MDCKFENISVQKKENLLEMYKRTLRKSFPVYGIAVAVLFLLFVVTSLLTGTIYSDLHGAVCDCCPVCGKLGAADAEKNRGIHLCVQ